MSRGIVLIGYLSQTRAALVFLVSPRLGRGPDLRGRTWGRGYCLDPEDANPALPLFLSTALKGRGLHIQPQSPQAIPGDSGRAYCLCCERGDPAGRIGYCALHRKQRNVWCTWAKRELRRVGWYVARVAIQGSYHSLTGGCQTGGWRTFGMPVFQRPLESQRGLSDGRCHVRQTMPFCSGSKIERHGWTIVALMGMAQATSGTREHLKNLAICSPECV